MSDVWPDDMPPLPWEPPVTVQAIDGGNRPVGESAAFDLASGGRSAAHLRGLPAGYVKDVLLRDSTGRELYCLAVRKVLAEGDELTVSATVRPPMQFDFTVA
jgi:hypothetical protein